VPRFSDRAPLLTIWSDHKVEIANQSVIAPGTIAIGLESIFRLMSAQRASLKQT
jgi:hypothetical protein